MPYRTPNLNWRIEPLPALDAETRWARAVKILARAAERLGKPASENDATEPPTETLEGYSHKAADEECRR